MATAMRKEVWQDVEVNLELSLEFDPEAFSKRHPGLSLVLAELLIGPPRHWRDPAELLPYAGCKSLEARLPRLRFSPLETRFLARALDQLFTTIEFSIVGHKVLTVPPPSKATKLPEGWRARSGVWLCHQPLVG
ncbi:hypothetical protein Mlute_00253 [Meiothermus luteus]|jgi:hypothetical protein|uniref:Uncharacterized protein n=1 Tax=Meiothermus luteus TaxID=2026184 RepID=A0A399F0D2_9DEIN|nr:hypothetical protein [Meiothermus luteus]RIH89738.1 hypothetical protein Mlute_00253 [Meiothermus luteus]RMH57814.1 MAG: hypothetical protein D6684_02420 [Deinococcota bacterium]